MLTNVNPKFHFLPIFWNFFAFASFFASSLDLEMDFFRDKISRETRSTEAILSREKSREIYTCILYFRVQVPDPRLL